MVSSQFLSGGDYIGSRYILRFVVCRIYLYITKQTQIIKRKQTVHYKRKLHKHTHSIIPVSKVNVMKNKKGQEKGALSSNEKREFVRSCPHP